MPSAEVAEGNVDRDVRLGRDDQVDARRAVQAIRFDVPAGAAQHAMPRGRQAGETRHLATGDEPGLGSRGQVEQVHQPPGGDVLDHRRQRRGRVDAGVLVPRRYQPVGGKRHRMAAADDESEVTRRAAGDRATRGLRGEQVQDASSVFAMLGQRRAQRGGDLILAGNRADMADWLFLEVSGCVASGPLEQRVEFSHGCASSVDLTDSVCALTIRLLPPKFTFSSSPTRNMVRQNENRFTGGF